MPQTVSEYLRRIEPREVGSKGRYKPVPEPRKRAFAATKQVLTAAPTDLHHAHQPICATQWHSRSRQLRVTGRKSRMCGDTCAAIVTRSIIRQSS
jgi:hypothetical protein